MNSNTPDEKRGLPPEEESVRDWTEDFSHENWKYQSVCFKCGLVFQGHKRRIFCKLCDTVMSQPDSQRQEETEICPNCKNALKAGTTHDHPLEGYVCNPPPQQDSKQTGGKPTGLSPCWVCGSCDHVEDFHIQDAKKLGETKNALNLATRKLVQLQSKLSASEERSFEFAESSEQWSIRNETSERKLEEAIKQRGDIFADRKALREKLSYAELKVQDYAAQIMALEEELDISSKTMKSDAEKSLEEAQQQIGRLQTMNHELIIARANVEKERDNQGDTLAQALERIKILQVRCLAVRDAVNKFWKNKTLQNSEEIERTANNCNQPDLLEDLEGWLPASIIEANKARDLAQQQVAVMREALEQWMKGEEHAEKDEIIEASSHYVEALNLTKAALSNRSPTEFVRREVVEKMKSALEAITRRVPIMASTGDYRAGQEHALEACSEVAKEALSALDPKP